ncbi:P-loop containing nucleoside triphosphate hydrolase protein [Aspergillus karnatakaensis]|uniref:ABC transporter ATP-binding protein n=1 Tax=Aspergillus karnatakaensis TaxID=1810916 RepID=UPI003CCDD481
MGEKEKEKSEAEKPSLLTRCTTFARLLVYGNPSFKELTVLFIGLLSAIASGVPFPIMAIVFGQLVDDMNSSTCNASPENASSLQSGVNDKVLQIVYIGIAYFVLIYIYVFCWNLSGEWLAQRMREKYFHSLLKQDATFFDTLPPGEASSRITGDITTIQQGTSEKVGIVLNSIAFFITSYIVAFIKDARLAGMLVSIAPAYLIMSLVGGYFVRKYFGRALECMASASSVALEAFTNTMVVHAFSASARLESRFVDHLGPARVAGIRKSIATATQAGLLYFIAFSANALAFWQGSTKIANAVEEGNAAVTVGNTYTVILVLVDASLILSQVAPFLQSFDAASVAFKKLEKDIERPSSIDGTAESVGLVPSGELTPDVELRNVAFRFPSRPDKPILQDLSLKIPAGKQTALVGLSGSGKSTVAGLITRFYDAEEGAVFIGGHDVRTLNVRYLRSAISLVQQEPCLLDRSILENIALGLVNSAAHVHLADVLKTGALEDIATAVREKGLSLDHAIDSQTTNATEKEHIREIMSLVEHAAGLADANNFIRKLDHGFATMVGSSGNLISGGQKQRISIARALVKNPQILILDEATASLDSATEMRVQQALETAAAGRTLVTIAHRLSTIRNADNIIVMRQGKLIEQGSHSELLAADGAYAELVRLQNLNVNASNDDASSLARPSLDSTTLEKEKVTEVHSVQDDESSSTPKEKPTEQEPVAAERSGKSTSKAVASLFRPYSLALLIAITGAVIIGGTYCASAVIFGNVVGKLSACEEAQSIRDAGEFWGLMFFVLAIIEFFANFISWSLFGWIAEQLIYKVRVLSLRSILEQKLEWHEARTPSGLLSLIVKDSNALNGLTGSVICTILSILVNLVAAITMTHIIAWRIALVCLSVVPLLLGAGWMRVSSLATFEERHNDAFARSLGITVEAVTSIKTVHALAIESEVLHTYRRSLQGPIREIAGQSAYTNLWLAVGYGLSNFVYALAYWWGAKQIIAGHYTQTQFFIVQLALLVSSQLWGQMFALAPDVSRAVQATRRLLNLLDLGSTEKLSDPITTPLSKDLEATSHPDEKPPPPSPDTPRTGLSIAFRNVEFTYPARPDTQVLHGLDLSIAPGQFAALVGPSGAGKSTIISLIERLYSPSSGSIEINNQDVAHANLSFRDEIAYVPQQSVLFDGSIRFNLELGARPGQSLTQADLEAACQLANIHDTIMGLPDGYETACGPNGDRLSGGQKQRLAIARALIRKPRLLLLDESTSALDAESERLLQDGLEKAARGITVIAIAHRLYTIRKADVIFLVEEGRVVERGTHAELVERSESYRVNALNQAVDG